jgi:hypothetical protein
VRVLGSQHTRESEKLINYNVILMPITIEFDEFLHRAAAAAAK